MERILYCYPEEITDELIDAIKRNPKVCNYLDMPIQHGADDVLRRMGRWTNREQIENTVSKLRKEIPDIVLRTTLITGFPGETEEDFADTMDVVEKVQYDSAFTFIYSKRTGTPAAAMEDQVPEEVVKERFDRLLERVQQIAAVHAGKDVGKVVEVLVEEQNGQDASLMTGRTSQNYVVHFPGETCLIGKIIPVKLIESKGFYYMGEQA